MNPAVKKQLRRYRKMYRRHMMMQQLKGTLFDHDEGRLPPLAIGILVVIGVVGGLVAGLRLFSYIFAEE